VEPESEVLTPGAVLDDRYEILKVIAEGGMSIVYEVEDQRLKSRFALKQMRELVVPKEHRESMLAQFTTEAEVLSRLSHSNLPKVTDHFVWETGRFLVEELVEGRTLEEILEDQCPRTEREVLDWALQICDALEYLHDRGIVYRDMKPSNVILSAGGTIKLVDFGIIRFFTMGKPRDTVIMGTPGFAAPEQYGADQTDPRSDIFSLGAMIHHLITGHDPSKSPFVFPPVRTLNPAISAQMEEVLHKALALDPSLRFQSMGEMRRALQGEGVILEEGETFRYDQAPPDKIPHAASMLVAVAGGVIGVCAILGNPWFAAPAVFYSPLWITLIVSSYRRQTSYSRLAIVVSESGIHYRDDHRRLSLNWEEVTGLEFATDGFLGVKTAIVHTTRGDFSFFIDTSEGAGPMLNLTPLVNAKRLVAVITGKAHLIPDSPGSSSYRRR
jgi:tRNA A-37 threonylcarbamoyl transferase component Bud32